MIEKILERLGERCDIIHTSEEYLPFSRVLVKSRSSFEKDYDTQISIKEAIAIVQEAAKDCEASAKNNNSWIPVKHGLPSITNTYLVTKMCENDGNPIYETAHEIFWTTDGKWDCERDEYCDWKVIAWQNKIAPYQKGE